MNDKTEFTASPAAAVAPARPTVADDRPVVSILIVAFNSAALIADCLDAIPPGAARHGYEVLMVDNGDGSTEAMVRQAYPWVRIVPSRGNIGFAAGNNLLAGHAMADRLLLLNPDMVAFPGAIDALVDGSLAYPTAAAWGGVTVSKDGRHDSGNAIAMPSLIEFASVALGRSRIGHAPLEGIERDTVVDILIGGFVMFSRDVWEQMGGLDERYFLYGEEVDLFFRLNQLGYKVWRISKAYGTHTTAHGGHLSPMRLLYRAAGTMQFLRLHWSWPARILAAFLLWVAAVERVLAGKLLGHVRPHLRDLGEGYRYVAARPSHWLFGYDQKRGLMARLADDGPPR